MLDWTDERDPAHGKATDCGDAGPETEARDHSDEGSAPVHGRAAGHAGSNLGTDRQDVGARPSICACPAVERAGRDRKPAAALPRVAQEPDRLSGSQAAGAAGCDG